MGEKVFAAVRVTLGGKKPKVEELTSNLADALGVDVPIPVWAITWIEINNPANNKKCLIIIENLRITNLVNYKLTVASYP